MMIVLPSPFRFHAARLSSCRLYANLSPRIENLSGQPSSNDIHGWCNNFQQLIQSLAGDSDGITKQCPSRLVILTVTGKTGYGSLDDPAVTGFQEHDSS